MKRYAVHITDEALSDMERIYNHIADVLLSPENALGQYRRITNAILKLDTFPLRFRTVELETGSLNGLRRMLVDNYSVFYTVQEDSVVVTKVLYSASDFERRLTEDE